MGFVEYVGFTLALLALAVVVWIVWPRGTGQ